MIPREIFWQTDNLGKIPDILLSENVEVKISASPIWRITEGNEKIMPGKVGALTVIVTNPKIII